jgi:hypothetical protein
MAAAAGDEDQRHQSAADCERQHHAEDQRDPAMDADPDRIEAGQDPGRAGKRQEQKNDEESDEEAGPQS